MRKSSHRLSSSSVWLFLAGLGSMTEVHFFGSIALTELAFIALGPILFFKEYYRLKNDGFMLFIALSLLTCLGCIISSKVNDTYWLLELKGLAVPVVYFVATVCFHWLLRRNLGGMKWFLIGVFFSSIVSTFIFQQETLCVDQGEITTGSLATEIVMNNALFWSSRINGLLRLPLECAYLQVPQFFNCILPIVMAAISLVASEGSGRAAAVVATTASLIILVGGKKRQQLRSMGRYLIFWLVVLACLELCFKSIYAKLAKGGALGENAQKKYERQTATGSGILNILMSGRMELFCGMQACIDHPIVGLGPRAEDIYGYTENYLNKYGSQDDFENFLHSTKLMNERYGYCYRQIPCHSHLIFFWLYFGLFGLLLWLYVFWLMYKYLRSYASTVPQWHGYMSMMIPSMCWNILFSPPGGRLATTFFVVCLLFCRAVSQRRIALPYEMEMEVLRLK